MNGTAALTLPALSLHVPLSEIPVPSGPEYGAELHDAMPDVGSTPVQVAVSEWL